ncbi:hypothetical protein IAT38_003311 [Cryptococcus sp. DSM 104549]
MSLYTDEDVGQISLQDDKPTLHAPADPGHALTAALALPTETPEQQEGLIAAGERFEAHPERLYEVLPRLMPMITEGRDSLLRFWTLDMISLAVGRSRLPSDVKLLIAQQCLPDLNQLLNSPSANTIKAVIPIFSTIYPLLFRLLATTRPPEHVFDLFKISKARILALALDPAAQPANVGVKAVAWKFLQKVLLAATPVSPTKQGADPRLQARNQGGTDVDINHITPNSPLNTSDIEREGSILREQLITHLYSASDPAILHPLINTLPILAKARPPLAPLVISSLTSWTPAAMSAAGRPAMEIRAVDKTVRVVMSHLVRQPGLVMWQAQLNDALQRQKLRMEAAYVGEAGARRERRKGLKHGMEIAGPGAEAESSEQAAKRARLDRGYGGKGPEVDVSGMRLEAVVEGVVSGLKMISAESLAGAFDYARRALAESSPDAIPLLASGLGVAVKEEDDDEVLNPLDMDMDDDDDDLLLGDVDVPIDEEEPTTFTDFTLPAPTALEPTERDSLRTSTIERIWQSGAELALLPDPEASDAVKTAVKPKEVWMLLLARLATRGTDTERKAISDYVTADFAERSKFASVWLNEEWFNEKIGAGTPGQYISILESIIASYLPKLDAKDKHLNTFILNLPSIPPSIITTLSTLSQDPERCVVGLLTLRDIVESRPPARPQALQTLLELSTHPERRTRVQAIITLVRKWGYGSAITPEIVKYALGVLWRLVPEESEAEKPEAGADADTEMEEGEQPEEKVTSPFLGPVTPDTVQQHVELAFALTKRQQDLLDDIFRLYPKLTPDVQEAVTAQLMPLVQSLGPTEKLLGILGAFPKGAETLASKVIAVLSAEGSSPGLTEVIKRLLGERELDAKFVVPVIGDLDKTEIEKQLPKIVALLADPENKDMVRQAFAAMLQKMTPSDLLVALHGEEAPLKLTIEAIGICFSMTTVFRSDVLANAMSRMADLPSLPVVFLRTIIQVLTTYKSLAPFVANHILPKLVSKKIWENPQLWDGFVRLAKLIAPASFGALLQLPKEQLRDVVVKQPALKAGLKGFLATRSGNKAAVVEIFGEE